MFYWIITNNFQLLWEVPDSHSDRLNQPITALVFIVFRRKLSFRFTGRFFARKRSSFYTVLHHFLRWQITTTCLHQFSLFYAVYLGLGRGCILRTLIVFAFLLLFLSQIDEYEVFIQHGNKRSSYSSVCGCLWMFLIDLKCHKQTI